LEELAEVLRGSLHPLTGPIEAGLARRHYGAARFRFLGASLQYYVHHYHNTWISERAVEIPIALHYLKNLRTSAEVLEVGNVLSHYPDGLKLIPRFRYTIVDKDEKAPGVVNEDVIGFSSPKRFDLILSISTLEHVGLDDGGEPMKWRAAVARLTGLLAKNGTMLVTMPIGYNPDVDQCLRDQTLPFEEVHYLKRLSRDNLWGEARLDEVRLMRYNFPHRAGNAIIVGFLTGHS
jgi:hypothetical protein